MTTEATVHPNVKLIQDYQAAMARGDTANAETVFDPKVKYRVPGHNRLSGEYTGAHAVMGYFGKLMEITGGTYQMTPRDWLVSDDRVLLLTDNSATINGQTFTWPEGLLFEIHNHKKVRIDMFQYEQDALDAFLG